MTLKGMTRVYFVELLRTLQALGQDVFIAHALLS